MFQTFQGPRARRVAVVLSTVVAVTLLATAISATGVFAARAGSLRGSIQVRSASCDAFDFRTIDSQTGFDYFNAKRIRAGTAGSGFFTCDPKLPHRAVVTKVQFSIWDGRHSQVKFCGLYRSGLTETTSDVVQELAALPPTGLPRRRDSDASRTPPSRTPPSTPTGTCTGCSATSSSPARASACSGRR